jgi:hypothetical protein
MATRPKNDAPIDDDDGELIAYLDGELDDDATRAVESRLAEDETSRKKIDAYQKTYDLLDYLPKPAPSPNFASRTLTALQPSLPRATGAGQTEPTTQRIWPETLGWAAAAMLASLATFLIASFISSKGIFAKRELASAEDYKLMGKLPLYIGIDDLEFLKGLDQSDLFDPTETIGTTPATTGVVERGLPQPSDEDRDKLYEQFQTFSSTRQQQLRTLHQQLIDPTLPNRDNLLRTLDSYAIWLDRLQAIDRKRILEATPGQRLEEVASVHMRLWRESLSEAKRQSLKEALAEEKAELVSIYRDQQQSRRNEWQLAQRQWKELSGNNKSPWPFNDPKLAEEIDTYIKTAFGFDPSKLPIPEKNKKWELPTECRLTPDELLEFRLRREATRDGYWLTYGALLLRLSEAHPMLPRPKAGMPIVRPQDLPKGYLSIRENPPLRGRTIGKWPDFALEVVRQNRTDAKLDPLGPCRAAELSETIQAFIRTALSDADRRKLELLQGRWPQYPQKFLELAREKNLSVPEIMLPGEPKKWQEFYQLPSGKK